MRGQIDGIPSMECEAVKANQWKTSNLSSLMRLAPRRPPRTSFPGSLQRVSILIKTREKILEGHLARGQQRLRRIVDVSSSTQLSPRRSFRASLSNPRKRIFIIMPKCEEGLQGNLARGKGGFNESKKSFCLRKHLSGAGSISANSFHNSLENIDLISGKS